jgi:FAD/FMN-containing dehydrogenase
VADDATAFSHRGTQFDFNTGASWTDPRDDGQRIEAARRVAAAMAPFSRGVYSNTSGEVDTQTTQRAFAPPTAARLAQIKASYDPDNVFRHNTNIAPAGPPVAGPGGVRG